MRQTCIFILLPFILHTGACKTPSAEKSARGKAKKTITTAGNITGKYWKLTWLYGYPVEWKDDGGHEPYIMLHHEENRLEGSGGCNRMTGNFILKEKNMLSFPAIATTKMACLDMETETRMLDMLEKTDRYVFDGEVLRFYYAGEIVAKFREAGAK